MLDKLFRNGDENVPLDDLEGLDGVERADADGDGTDTTEADGEGEDEDGEELTVEDLDSRIDELETRLDRQSSDIDAVRSSQSELSDRLDEMDDRVRRLVGVYDRLTADVNPFAVTPDGESEFRFGVVGRATEGDASDGEAPASDAERGEGVVTVGDLADAEDARSAGRETDGAPDETTEARGEDDRAEPEEGAPSDPPPEAALVSDSDGDAPLLTSLADGYATDTVTLEWLSMLVSVGGPAGAFRALQYYEEIGWLGEDIRETLEGVLSAPDIDADVDPSAPTELTVEDHARSHEYVLKLGVLRDIDAEA